MSSDRPTVLVFGCFGEVGHYRKGPGWETAPVWLERWADYVPHQHAVQREGATWLLMFRGWTALGWWDRQGPDIRGGCHTTLLADGIWTAREMLDAAPPWAVRVAVDLDGVQRVS